MVMYSGYCLGSDGMRRFPLLVCMAFLLLLFHTGIASADSPNATTTATAAVKTTTPDRIGGSIYFETDPPGVTIWLDNVEIGTSPFMYYTEKTGTLDVSVWKKGYEGYADKVTVEEGKRVDFYAKLTEVPRTTFDEKNTAVPVATATTIRKSTLTIPTPWPTTPKSAVDPAVIIGAAVVGTGFLVIRRR
jgi:PEGA domain